MKQVVFISGKGGTGKSTVVASLSLLVKNKIIADCDVDAPNLHLLIKGERLHSDDYFGAELAVIDSTKCVSCGICRDICRFDAISEKIEIKPMKCEGCGACVLACPQAAISMIDLKIGETYVDQTQRGTFSHALLDIGADGSGKLVTEVKENLFAFLNGEDWALIDGSPGIGCSVIASITGADAVVAVCEPTRSGQSDLERVLGVARHFGIPAFVCINKYDLNLEITAEIKEFCEKNGIPLIGKIPFEPAIVKALQLLQTPVEAGIKNIVGEIENIWSRLQIQLGTVK
ncbi:MAG: ATP-binding protein [Eubacteriales bacterium]|nr:ATP-binding protein [Eubacteriales bacterium]